MEDPTNQTPDPDELTIEPSVRAIGQLGAEGTGRVLEPFSGLLHGGEKQTQAGSDASDSAVEGVVSTDSVPELSYLTLQPLVVRELRTRIRDPPADQSESGSDTEPPASGDDGAGERLTVREYLTGERDKSSDGESGALPGQDSTSTASGRKSEQDPSRSGGPGSDQRFESRSVPTGRPSRDSPPDTDGFTSGLTGRQHRRGSVSRESVAGPERPGGSDRSHRGVSGRQERSADSPDGTSSRPLRSEGDSRPAGVSDVDPSVTPDVESSSGASRPSPSSADDPLGESSRGSAPGSPAPPWGELPRTVVVDSAGPPEGNENRRQRSRQATLDQESPSTSGGPPDVGDQPTEPTRPARESDVVEAIATARGQPFDRLVDRLSEELEQRERTERERRGL